MGRGEPQGRCLDPAGQEEKQAARGANVLHCFGRASSTEQRFLRCQIARYGTIQPFLFCTPEGQTF